MTSTFISGTNVSVRVDMNVFFDRRCEFYTYRGSTTTPMCNEAVQWLTFREPLTVTPEAVSTNEIVTQRGQRETTLLLS